jgi:hypothetical protein
LPSIEALAAREEPAHLDAMLLAPSSPQQHEANDLNRHTEYTDLMELDPAPGFSSAHV